jgi:predicted nucleotidyltransferase
MPVRSLSSAVLKWPDREEVLNKAVKLALKAAESDRSIKMIIAHGSIADPKRWGVGSDLDILLVVADSNRAFIERGRCYDFGSPGVPVDMSIYTVSEFKKLKDDGRSLAKKLEKNSIILFSS